MFNLFVIFCVLSTASARALVSNDSEPVVFRNDTNGHLVLEVAHLDYHPLLVSNDTAQDISPTEADDADLASEIINLDAHYRTSEVSGTSIWKLVTIIVIIIGSVLGLVLVIGILYQLRQEVSKMCHPVILQWNRLAAGIREKKELRGKAKRRRSGKINHDINADRVSVEEPNIAETEV